jgi:hypothetical protein
MKLGPVFTTAWKSFKGFVLKTDSYLQANEPKIQAGVKVAEKVAVFADPGLTPAVTIFDGLEESAMGEITAAFHTGAALVNATDGTATVTLSAELVGVLRHLANTLAGHPDVVAALSVTKAV